MNSDQSVLETTIGNTPVGKALRDYELAIVHAQKTGSNDDCRYAKVQHIKLLNLLFRLVWPAPEITKQPTTAQPNQGAASGAEDAIPGAEADKETNLAMHSRVQRFYGTEADHLLTHYASDVRAVVAAQLTGAPKARINELVKQERMARHRFIFTVTKPQPQAGCAAVPAANAMWSDEDKHDWRDLKNDPTIAAHDAQIVAANSNKLIIKLQMDLDAVRAQLHNTQVALITATKKLHDHDWRHICEKYWQAVTDARKAYEQSDGKCEPYSGYKVTYKTGHKELKDIYK